MPLRDLPTHKIYIAIDLSRAQRTSTAALRSYDTVATAICQVTSPTTTTGSALLIGSFRADAKSIRSTEVGKRIGWSYVGRGRYELTVSENVSDELRLHITSITSQNATRRCQTPASRKPQRINYNKNTLSNIRGDRCAINSDPRSKPVRLHITSITSQNATRRCQTPASRKPQRINYNKNTLSNIRGDRCAINVRGAGIL
ncbi:hypothetical protein J6590_069050 [Homalodisca vitripennis]|nr:hypothetical protein J6590_069050 [Homalodisca vitripennis]